VPQFYVVVMKAAGGGAAGGGSGSGAGGAAAGGGQAGGRLEHPFMHVVPHLLDLGYQVGWAWFGLVLVWSVGRWVWLVARLLAAP
jgi:hypothetical protein